MDPSLSRERRRGVLRDPSSNYYPQMLARRVPARGRLDRARPGRTCPRRRRLPCSHGLGDEKIARRLRHARRARHLLVHARGRACCAAVMRKLPGERIASAAQARLEELHSRRCPATRATAPPEARDSGRHRWARASTTCRELSCRQSARRSSSSSRLEEQPAVIARAHRQGDPRTPASSWSTWVSTTSRSTAPRPRSRAARRSASAWPRRSAPGLMGVLYILDEPSIGLHQRDNERLIDTLREPARPGQHRASWSSTTRTPSARADYVVDIGTGRRRAGRRTWWPQARRKRSPQPGARVTGALPFRAALRSRCRAKRRKPAARRHQDGRGHRANNLKNVTAEGASWARSPWSRAYPGRARARW